MSALLWELIREWPNGATDKDGLALEDELTDMDYHADWMAEVTDFGREDG